MVGISSRLLRSIIIITILHLSLGAIIYYSLSPAQYQSWSKLTGKPTQEVLNLASLNANLLEDFMLAAKSWFPLFSISVLLGLLFPLILILAIKTKRKITAKEKESYRGVTVSIGNLYKPTTPPISNKKFKFPNEFPEKYHSLLAVILNFHIKNTKKLFEILDAIDRALEKKLSSTLVIALVAKEIDSNPKESAKILSSFKQWWELEERDRTIIAVATEYYAEIGKLPLKIPYLSAEDRQEIYQLATYLGEETLKLEYKPEAESQNKNTSQLEKGKVDTPAISNPLKTAFINALKENPFQNFGNQKGLKAIGWRKENRLYLLQNALAEAIGKLLTKEEIEEIEQAFKKTKDAHSISQAVFNHHILKDWLVYEAETVQGVKTVDSSLPFWVIRTEEKIFSGILIFELPEEYRFFYPKETRYSLVIQNIYDPEFKKNAGQNKKKQINRELLSCPYQEMNSTNIFDEDMI